MSWFEEYEDRFVLNIRVIPRASKNSIQGLLGNALKIRLQAPPVEGKANQCLIRFLAKEWNLSRAKIHLLSGETGRNKRVELQKGPEDLKKVLLSYK